MEFEYAELEAGCKADFSDSGTPMDKDPNPGSEVTVVNVLQHQNKKGTVFNVRLITKNPLVGIRLNLDDYTMGVLGQFRDTPVGHLTVHGCAGRVGLCHLSRYDTINGKYVYEIVQPLEFGKNIGLLLKNWDSVDNAARAFCSIVWCEESNQ